MAGGILRTAATAVVVLALVAPASAAFATQAPPDGTSQPGPAADGAQGRAPSPAQRIVAPSTPSAPAPVVKRQKPVLGSDEYQQAVLDLVNARRATAGVGPLTIDSRLTAAAEVQAGYQASHSTLSHTGAGGSLPWDRIRAQGYPYCWAGENAAYGYASPKAVVSAWMSDAPHRANLLNAHFRNMGLASAADTNGWLYWTQDFGSISCTAPSSARIFAQAGTAV